MIKMKKRTLILTIACIMLSATVTGCGNNAVGTQPSDSATPADSAKPSGGDNAEKAELRISWWGSQSRHDATVNAIDIFMEKNPDITVTPEYQGWDGYHDKLVTQIASATEPDVFQFDNYRYMADFASSGKIMDLKPYIGSIIDLSGFNEDVLLWGQYKGVQYGIPTGINGTVVEYNKAMFDKAGLEYPTDDWTWEDFIEAGKKIHQTDPDAYGMKEADWYITSIMLRQQGKLIVDEKGEIQDFRAELKDVYTQFNEWRTNGVMPSLELSAAQDTQQDNLFLNGKAAMMIKSVAQLPMDQAGMKDNAEIDAVMVPGTKGTGSVFMEGSMPLTIGINSEYKEAAAKLINFLVNDTDAAAKLMTCRGVPASKAASDSILPTLGEADKKVFSAVDRLIDITERIDYYWTVKGGSQIGVILDEEKDKTGYGDETPEQAANEAYDRIIEAVQEANK